METPKNFKNILMGVIYFWGILTLLVYILSLSSCKHEVPNPCNFNDLHYKIDIKPIIKRNCATSGCHNNSNGLGNFENYNELNEICNNGNFERRVLRLKNMPPFKMDTCDFIKLKMWYLNGHKSD